MEQPNPEPVSPAARLVKDAGDVWGDAEQLMDEMRSAQAAAMQGNVRAAQEHYSRGERVIRRLANRL